MGSDVKYTNINIMSLIISRDFKFTRKCLKKRIISAADVTKITQVGLSRQCCLLVLSPAIFINETELMERSSQKIAYIAALTKKVLWVAASFTEIVKL